MDSIFANTNVFHLSDPQPTWLFDVSFYNVKNNTHNTEFINLFDNYFLKNRNELNYKELLQYKLLYVILIYNIFRLNNYSIDKKIKQHFAVFKIRDI